MRDKIFANLDDKWKFLPELIEKYREQSLRDFIADKKNIIFITLEEFSVTQLLENFSFDIFNEGLIRLSRKLSTLGCDQIPKSRFLIGIAQRKLSEFGGFHTPLHGYRHLEQISVSSVIRLSFPSREVGEFLPALRALELLRSIAHDAIHHASYRVYRINENTVDSTNISEMIYRWQYGINFRKSNGVSYSNRDAGSSKTTRNLGVIMEAVTDRFATEFVREYGRATLAAVAHANGSPIEKLIALDIEGSFDDKALAIARSYEVRDAEKVIAKIESQFVKSMRLFNQYVTQRWVSARTEIAPICFIELETQILLAILSGKLNCLVAFFDAKIKHSGAFKSLFRQSTYNISK